MMSPVYHFTIYLCLSLLKFTFRRWSCTCMWHLVYLCGLCLVLYTQTPPSLSSSQARGGPQRYTVSTWLQIQNLHLSDTGIYFCISHNALRETSASTRLTTLRQGESELQILTTQYVRKDVFPVKNWPLTFFDMSLHQSWGFWKAVWTKRRMRGITMMILRKAAMTGGQSLETTLWAMGLYNNSSV